MRCQCILTPMLFRSTSNIVNAAEKVISGDASKGKVDDPRRAMTPQRGSGPSPRIVACADERAEGKGQLVFR